MLSIENIRNVFLKKYLEEDFVIDKTGCKIIEVLGSSFLANEETIFGKVNSDYIKKELDWYCSQSLNVYDIPNTPKIWQQVATPDGRINSNYGYLIFSNDNGLQYLNTREALASDKNTRRATMIYTRPSIQVEYNKDGMSD